MILSLLLQAHKNCGNMSEIEAKVRYVKLARSLKTYGVSFFLVKVELQPPDPTSHQPEFLFFSIPPFVVSPVATPQPILVQFSLCLHCPSCLSLCTVFPFLGSCFFSFSSRMSQAESVACVAIADIYGYQRSLPERICHNPSVVAHRRR